MSEMRMIDAIRLAMDEALGADPAVCLLGEDVTAGGPFGSSRDLVERHGPLRVRDTPISEATVAGLAVGAALSGLRPIVEVMFVDFATLAMDQLVNHAAKLRYMSGGQLQVPLTVRMQFGATGSMGAQHSQSLEAWFAHVPGLKVVVPSTPADARQLLRRAVEDDDPVIFLEHRGLYWSRGEVPDTVSDRIELGSAEIRRRGEDVTIVAYGAMVARALEAAELVQPEGIHAEVIDLRTLVPLDLDTLCASVDRTGHLVVAHEAVSGGGFGAEVVAAVTERSHAALRAPARRVAAPFVPVPASPDLESHFVPSVARVADAARQSIHAT
jgi:acetoin:2,6-dichlorophenolindophenol oxidoreductase subunit beta